MLTAMRFSSFSLLHSEWEEISQKVSYLPFQSPWYQEVFARHFCRTEDLYLMGIYAGSEMIAYGGFERIGNQMLLIGMKEVMGGEKLTDYGDIVVSEGHITPAGISEIWQMFIAYFRSEGIEEIRLDYVRQDSSTCANFFQNSDWNTRIIQQEVAPFIPLPASWDEYLLGLNRVERKELKRKLKRLENIETVYSCSTDTHEDLFEEFIRLHRLSDPVKEKFMSQEMKMFFKDVFFTDKKNWKSNLCFLTSDKKPVAVIMDFSNSEKTLVYNSGFDPRYRYYSVGLIAHAMLIKSSIESGQREYDFLRGSERYKYDLGSIHRNLYQILVLL